MMIRVRAVLAVGLVAAFGGIAAAQPEDALLRLRADVLDIAKSLAGQVSTLQDDPQHFRVALEAEAAAHDLPEAIVFDRQGRVLASAGLCFAMAFELAPQDAVRSARTDEPAIVRTAHQRRLGALVPLGNDTYL